MTTNPIVRCVALAVALVMSALGAACTLEGQGAPALAGPSEFGLSLGFSASPDQLFRNGAAQSIVTVTARGPDGKPVGGQTLAVGIGTLGTASAQTVTTGEDGRATFAVVSPPLDSAGDEIRIQLRPMGGNAADTSVRQFAIGVYPSNPSAPVAAFTITPENAIVNQTVVFDASGTRDEGLSCQATCAFEWDFGDGNSGTGMVTTHRYTTGGVKVVTLTVRDQVGATSRFTRTITVSALAPPTITVSPNPPKSTEAATFTAVATVPPGVVVTQYTWTWGDGSPNTTSTSGTVTHTYGSVGAFTVTVLVEDSLGGSSTGILGVNVVAP